MNIYIIISIIRFTCVASFLTIEISLELSFHDVLCLRKLYSSYAAGKSMDYIKVCSKEGIDDGIFKKSLKEIFPNA